jgi:hypothetical protein
VGAATNTTALLVDSCFRNRDRVSIDFRVPRVMRITTRHDGRHQSMVTAKLSFFA